jgi:flagellar motor switch protein FliM
MAVNTPPSAPQVYDFARPGRLRPADRKRLGYLHTDLAKRLELALAGLVRDYVEVTAGDPTEVRCSEFVASLPSRCAVFTFRAPPLEGSGLLHVDSGLAFGLVDRVFGGRGEPMDLNREFTAIEQRVLGRFADAVLAEVCAVWRPVLELEMSRSGFASSPDLIEGSGVDEPLIKVEFKVDAGPLSGSFHIAYPHHMFEPAIRALAPTGEAREEEPAGVRSPAMVRSLSLPIAVRLETTLVSMKHLVGLSEGDVLLLDNRASDDVEVLVGGKPVMKGHPGSQGGRLAVKITRFNEEGG